MPKIELIQGDCLEKMKDIPDGSVDAIVTDPPYGLSFMGKNWDKGVPGVEFWIEMLRVLKHGGYLLSFSGTRTYHRMAVAIEDAGFEIRDMIEWVYGSGFPKSLNIGKKIDQLQGNEREVVGEKDNKSRASGVHGGGQNTKTKTDPITKGTSEWEGWGTALKPAHEPICMARKPLSEKTVAENVLKWGTGGINIDASRVELNGDYKCKANGRPSQTGLGDNYDPANANKPDTIGRFPANLIHDNSEEVRECFPETKSGSKPAHEPICMARKPLSEKTVAENVLKYGTGGINIDESRVGTEDKLSGGTANGSVGAGEGWDRPWRTNEESISQRVERHKEAVEKGETLGRFPANLIHDNSEEVRECFPDSKSTAGVRKNKQRNETNIYGGGDGIPQIDLYSGHEDSGNASRFFKSIIYQAKASKKERNKGCEGLEEKEGSVSSMTSRGERERGESRNDTVSKNNHPTVKPIALMEYLINMITSKGGNVLDPFMGSGTTGVACVNLNRNFIGIELDPEYLKIAEKRINENRQDDLEARQK